MNSKDPTSIIIARAFAYTAIAGGWMMVLRFFLTGKPESLPATAFLFVATIIGTVAVLRADMMRRN